MKPRIQKKEAIAPPDYEAADVYAIQALMRGEANETQQKRALDWIVNAASRAFDVSFRPGAPDETAFAEGRRFVGLQIDKMTRLNPAIFDRPPSGERR